MSIEYNCSHEETVSGWDTIIAKNKEKFQLLFGWTKIKEFKIEDLNKENHKLIDSNIDLENDNDSLEDNYDFLTYNFQSIIANCILAIHILDGVENKLEIISDNDLNNIWEKQIKINRALMIEKNKNYGSSWSIMRPEGITDVIHTKIHRVISLIEGEENKFESIKDSFEDIINYCVFCIMKMDLMKKKGKTPPLCTP